MGRKNCVCDETGLCGFHAMRKENNSELTALREENEKIRNAAQKAYEALEAMKEWEPTIRGWNPVSRALLAKDEALKALAECGILPYAQKEAQGTTREE